MHKRINLCIQGNAANESEWSGTAYYCGKALEKKTEIAFFNVQPTQSQFKKMWWRFVQFLQGKSLFGFQYSKQELKQLTQQINRQYESGTLISFNQLLPNDGEYDGLIYYIDCTLHELFQSSSYDIKLSDSRKKELLEIEKKNYKKADAIMVMGSWLKNSLTEFYGISQHKVHHVLPGANISTAKVFPSPQTSSLNIGFVAKDYKRKGLYYLLEVAENLKNLGLDVQLYLVGDCPEEVAQLEQVNYLGYINKKEQEDAWFAFLKQCHFGALFSSDEALGISVLEFLSAGIPVMGYYHQGLKDTLVEGASIRVKLGAPANEIANNIYRVWSQKDQYLGMRSTAAEQKKMSSWSRAAEEIMAITRHKL
jgi:glycosyltransferase involved in cell wall biosynthesis